MNVASKDFARGKNRVEPRDSMIISLLLLFPFVRYQLAQFHLLREFCHDVRVFVIWYQKRRPGREKERE